MQDCTGRILIHLTKWIQKVRPGGKKYSSLSRLGILPWILFDICLTGIETVRRDNCLLVKNLVTECLHKILIDRDVPGAMQYVKNTVSDLLMGRVDLSLLVITKVRT